MITRSCYRSLWERWFTFPWHPFVYWKDVPDYEAQEAFERRMKESVLLAESVPNPKKKAPSKQKASYSTEDCAVDDNMLGMSMFASRGDYESAAATLEPAFESGGGGQFDGGGASGSWGSSDI